MQIDTVLTRKIVHTNPCGPNIENNYIKASVTPTDQEKLPNQRRSKKIGDGAETEHDVLQKQQTKVAKG